MADTFYVEVVETVEAGTDTKPEWTMCLRVVRERVWMVDAGGAAADTSYVIGTVTLFSPDRGAFWWAAPRDSDRCRMVAGRNGGDPDVVMLRGSVALTRIARAAVQASGLDGGFESLFRSGVGASIGDPALLASATVACNAG